MTRAVLCALTSAALCLLLAGAPGCAPDSTVAQTPATTTQAILAGEESLTESWVVSLAADGAFLCTGSLMGPRVVLTARHCVDTLGVLMTADQLKVRLGSTHSLPEREVAVDAIRVPSDPRYQSGTQTPLFAGADFAVLLLTEGIDDVEPARLRRAPAEELRGDDVTMIGFGEQETGATGQRRKRTVPFLDVRDLTLLADDVICGGDSGGPMVDPEGGVLGVASFSSSGCAERDDIELFGKHAAIVKLPGFVDEALRDTGACDDAALEVCDGYDNDCDDDVDEGCAPAGEACATPEDCVARLDCVDDGHGQVCTIPCAPDGVVDAFAVVQRCPEGLVCARGASSCFVGTCRPPGPAEEGTACNEDDACASHLCAVDADGVSRCRAACQGADGVCREGLACAVDGDGCGTCIEDDNAGGSAGCSAGGSAPAWALLLLLTVARGRARFWTIAGGLALGVATASACGAEEPPITPYERPALLTLAPECRPDGIDQVLTVSLQEEPGELAVQRMNAPAAAFDVYEIGVSFFNLPLISEPEFAGECGCELPATLVAIVGVPGAGGALPEAPRVILEPAPVARRCLAQEHIVITIDPPLAVNDDESLWVGARALRDGDEVSCLAICAADPSDDNLIDGTLVDGELIASATDDVRLKATAVIAPR